MPSPSGAVFVLMFVAGCAVPTMAAINAGLGGRLGNPLAAVVVLCGVATLVSALLWMLGTPLGARGASGWRNAEPWHYLGGALFLVYILSATWAVPIIGLGNAIFLVLLGQLVTSAAIDHFGWFGTAVHALTPRRALGLAVMAIGVLLARRDALPLTG